MPEQKYDGWKSVWKGLQPALGVMALGAVLAFADVVSVEVFTDMGIPAAVAAFLVPAIKNWAKNRNLGKDSVGPR